MQVNQEKFAHTLTTIIYQLAEQDYKVEEIEIQLGKALGYEKPQRAKNYIRVLRSTQSNKGLPENPRKMSRRKLLETLSKKLFELSSEPIAEKLMNDLLHAGGYIGADELLSYLYQRYANVEDYIWEIPGANYEQLFGADELVSNIVELLERPNAPRFVSIEGIGGSGKTSIAHKVANELRESDEFRHFVWINCRKQKLDLQGNIHKTHLDHENTTQDILTQIAILLGFSEQIEANSSLRDKVKIFQKYAETRRTLIIIDNAEDLEDIDHLLDTLLRLDMSYYFLITTRASLGYLEYVHVRKALYLDFDAAYDIMKAEIQRTNSPMSLNPEHALQFYKIVGGNPLALKIMVLHSDIIDIKSITLNNSHEVTLFPDFIHDFLFQQIWEQLPIFQKHLLLDMLFISSDGEEANWIFTLLGLDSPDERRAFGDLTNMSLISIIGHEVSPLYFLHPLVSSFLHSQLEKDVKLKNHFEKRLSVIIQSASHLVKKHQLKIEFLGKHMKSFLVLIDYAQTFSSAQNLRLAFINFLDTKPQQLGYGYIWGNILRAELTSIKNETQKLNILYQLVEYLEFTNQYEEALSIVEEASQIALRESNTDLLIKLRQSHMTIHRVLHQWEQGFQVLDRTKQELNQLKSETLNLDVIYAVYKGLYLRASGNISEALETLEEGFRTLKSNSKEDKVLTLNLYNARGVLRWAKGDYEDALSDFQESQALYLVLDDVLGEAFCSGNLGLLYWSTARYKEAEQALRHCMTTYETVKSYGLVTMQVGNLGLVNFSRGLLDEAYSYCKKHLQMAENLQMIPEVLRAHGNLGNVLLAQGKREDAVYHLLHNFEMLDNGKNMMGVSVRMVNLAFCYKLLGEDKLAQDTLQKVSQYAEKIQSSGLKIILLRCQAEIEDASRKEANLLEAYKLAQGKHRLNEAACLISLAHINRNNSEGLQYWKHGVKLLEDIGAEAWLKGKHINDIPLIPLMM